MGNNIEVAGNDEKLFPALTIGGDGLNIDDVIRVSRKGAGVRLSDDAEVLGRVRRSREIIHRAVENGEIIYGVTTAFGGMANIQVRKEAAAALQNNVAWPHKTGVGGRLPESAVRASMLLRANSMMRGASGVRLELIQRLVDCLNADLVPHVHEMGSIGASGDLVPLAYVLGTVVGLDPAWRVSLKGEEMDCVSALDRIGLAPMELAPKEGLSVMNGTSVMAGIGAECIHDARTIMALALGAHALMLQGMGASNQSFHSFIQAQKPHPGQVWVADRMRDLLQGSRLAQDELNGDHRIRDGEPVQDRYSLRCLPQYLGPVVDGLSTIARQVEVEMNSATDNPLVDPERGVYYYCGNFLGQYVGVGMDQLRYYLGLVAKHLDVQIAMLVAPEFNNGLPPSLVGNPERRVNVGLKGLQITANSVMPLISFYGNSLADRFPTHAEQFNQNVNSQGFGSANLARQAMEAMRQYTAIALIFGIQAVDLRTKAEQGHYDARAALSGDTARLYEALLEVLGAQPSEDRPYVWNDDEQALDIHISGITSDIAADGRIPQSLSTVLESLNKFAGNSAQTD
jgi:phenylalanine ammonia-lyase